MLEHQKEHFMRDFLQFSHCVASYEFSYEHLNLLPENRCSLRGFRQFSTRLTKCYARHAICSLSPKDAALTMRFAKTRDMTHLKCGLPREMTMKVAKVLRLPRQLEHNSMCRNYKKLSNQRGQWKLFYMKPTRHCDVNIVFHSHAVVWHRLRKFQK